MSAFYSKHGMTNTKLYNVFKGIKSRVRCHSKRSSCYKGIDICNEWLVDSSSFIEWSLSNGYEEGLQIDRIDNLKGYSPENCRWVTAKVNSNNRSTTIIINVDGEDGTLSYFSEKYGVHHHTIQTRINRGWSACDAVKKPTQKRIKK